MRVFVHGVPETAVVWDALRDNLGGDSVALALPGFGAALPEGFTPTKDEYASWLTDELKKIRGPIDLVGHDWGALLTLRVATVGEVRLRSWTCDGGSVFHPEFAWNYSWAATLIAPGEGEEMLRRRRESSPKEAGALQVSQGVPERAAAEMFAGHDEVMSHCILGLYRSAVPNVSADWGVQAHIPTSAPGMILLPTGDQVDEERLSRQVARRLGARVEILDGLTHWWMYDNTGKATSALERFWGSVR